MVCIPATTLVALSWTFGDDSALATKKAYSESKKNLKLLTACAYYNANMTDQAAACISATSAEVESAPRWSPESGEVLTVPVM